MRLLRFYLIATSALLAVSCAASPVAPRQAPPREDVAYQILQSQAEPTASGDLVLATWPFLESTKLTASQKARLRALLKERQPPVTEADIKLQLQQWRKILSARQLDTTALKAFLQAREDEMRELQQVAQTMLVELRALLTDAQRNDVAKRIRRDIAAVKQLSRRAPSSQAGADATGADAPGLALSARQQALFKAAVPAPDPSRVEASARALADYFAGGSPRDFEAATVLEAPDGTRVDALVKAYASLTLKQRMTLVNAQ